MSPSDRALRLRIHELCLTAAVSPWGSLSEALALSVLPDLIAELMKRPAPHPLMALEKNIVAFPRDRVGAIVVNFEDAK